MKILSWVTLMVLSFGLFAQDAEDRQIMSLLQNKQYTHILNTPKGKLGGVLIFNKNGIAGIAASRDHMLGLAPNQITVYDRKGKNTAMKPDIIHEQKYYTGLIIHDESGRLGAPAINAKGPSAVVRFDSRSNTGVRALSMNGLGAVSGLVIGKVSLGALSGKVNGAGTRGGDKYKLYKQFPLGAVIARVNGNPITAAQAVGGANYSDEVAFFRVEGLQGDLDLVINDTQTSNNKGEFSVMFQ